MSPLYKEVIIDVKRGTLQGGTISLKLFSAALENIMHKLKWKDPGVKAATFMGMGTLTQNRMDAANCAAKFVVNRTTLAPIIVARVSSRLHE